MVKLATAVAHLIGRSNFDAMSGQYYARFVVKNVDNSDSYLRQPHRVMELHNDGTYVEEQTDYVLMMKYSTSRTCRAAIPAAASDHWEHLTNFSATRWLAAQCAGPRRRAKTSARMFSPGVRRRFAGPPGNALYRPVRPAERFRRRHLASRLSDALETSKNILSIPVPVGKFLLINNLFWLHGRDRFTPHPDLRRELTRQRGHFAYSTNHYQTHQ